MKHFASYGDITRTAMGMLGIALLIGLACWIVRPFMLAMLWASMIVAATWPFLLRLQKLLWGRRRLAALAMTVLLALLFIAPLVAAVGFAVAYSDRLSALIDSIGSIMLPMPPAWVETLPLIGPKLAGMWRDVVTTESATLSDELASHAGEIAAWLFRQAGNPGKTLFDLFLTVVISCILYFTGDIAAAGALRFFRRIAGEWGEKVAILAVKTVRGVALGVVMTAMIQAAAAGIGLAVTGVPAAGLLCAAMFLLCLAQLGPSPVLVPAVLWLFWSGAAGWGIVLLIWTVLVTPIDSFLRPLFIRKSVDIPTLLVLPGVIGGLLTLGIIGVFVGPVILAVTYSLFVDWVKDGEPPVGG